MLILYYLGDTSKTIGVFRVRRETGESVSMTQRGEDSLSIVSK